MTGKQPSRLSRAVVWRSPGGEVNRGRLELTEDGLRLSGSGPKGELIAVSISYGEFSEIHVGRSPDERINGKRSLVIESGRGGSIQLAPVDGLGTIFELGDLLATLKSEQRQKTSSVAVVVPLRRGSAEKVRSLLRQEPPFDPGTGFRRHQVFVGEQEVVFVFEGEDVREGLQRLARAPTVWKAAAAWEECIAGPPRLAEQSYAWPLGEVAPPSVD
jgi:hypothetical protein